MHHTKSAPLEGKNTRSASADILKAISIIAVVFIHGSGTIPFSITKLDFTSAQSDIAIKGLRFCVPVFIFLWAYFSEKSALKNGTKKSISRIYKLLIPFLFWSTLYFLMTADFKSLTFTSILSKHWSGYGWSGQYYFIILFQLILLFPLFRLLATHLKKHIPLLYLLSVVFYIVLSYSGWFHITAVSKINDRPFFYWIPYVLLGIIYANKSIFKFSIPLGLGLVSILMVPLELYWIHPVSESVYMLPSVFMCTMLLLNSMETNVSYDSMPHWIVRPIQKLASHTLGIFCVNPFVIIILAPLLRSAHLLIQFPGVSVIMPILSTFTVLVICIAIIYILKRVKLGLLVAN